MQWPYLQRQVPRDVDVRFVVVHPHLGHPQGVALGVETDVVVVGLLLALDVSHPGAGQDLHAAAAQPHLQGNRTTPSARGSAVVPRVHTSIKEKEVVGFEVSMTS